MGRPRKDAFAEETVVRVLRAAERAFGRFGYERTRLADLAEVAGIQRSSLLYHFRSKEDLYAMVVRAAFAELRGAVDQALETAGAEAGDPVDAFIESLVEFARHRRALVTVMLREFIDPTRRGRRLILAELEDITADLEAAIVALVGERPPGPYPLRAAILQIVAGYLVRTASGDLGDELWGREDHIRALARHLLVGP